MAGKAVTACYRTVGATPERLFFSVTADPVVRRGTLQIRHEVQLRLSVTYAGNWISAIKSRFSSHMQPDGSYIVHAELVEYLAGLKIRIFDGLTRRKRRLANRRGGRSRIHVALVNDLPDLCGVIACSRVLEVNNRTVTGWIILGAPVEYHGRRALIARETLRDWLRSTHRLVGEQ